MIISTSGLANIIFETLNSYLTHVDVKSVYLHLVSFQQTINIFLVNLKNCEFYATFCSLHVSLCHKGILVGENS